ncbi:DUF5134 domain-containing protein [Actinomycetospora sp. TBRC 11914]|uniref:DUF5134 domain-containing protein n=1 Tax=Actinomycetospora sp. TBRC 11914 TaxID=2729387 RepID=UPI00145DCB07|nr:DUF5134 domain-containing protein [Actinomycetospora sp. TBRC 11914]NMO91334.1 DUF5134 domain-containing protein [Actinomycetospora sp. TBRC 11914]
MFPSTLSWTFTVVFTLTGVYSLVRLTELASGMDRTGSRLTELSHLLMALAMIAMAWGWTGEPAAATGVLQILVFGLFGIWALARLTVPEGGHSRATEGYHLVANAAMVWMVAAMPLIMPSAPSAPVATHHEMAGMGAMPMPGSEAAPAASTPTWVVAVTVAFAVLVLAGAALWASRIVRPVGPGCCADGTPEIASGGSVAVAVAPARTRSTSGRLDACCHVLMSVGMAGTLLAML